MQDLEITRRIDKICKPILVHLPIQAVAFARFYDDHRRFCLSNSNAFITTFVDDPKYFLSVPQPRLPQGFTMQVRVFDSESVAKVGDPKLRALYEEMASDTCKGLGLQPALSILQRKDGYFDEFSFFPGQYDINPYESLLQSQEVLQHFMFYFLEHAAEIIRNTVPVRAHGTQISPLNDSAKKLCLQVMQTKKYYIDSNRYLTKREAHCAHLLASNKNSREISVGMGISIRTAEEYIENVKTKMQLTSKQELPAALCSLGFDRLVEF